MKKRLLASFLSLVLILTLLPTAAMAAPEDNPSGNGTKESPWNISAQDGSNKVTAYLTSNDKIEATYGDVIALSPSTPYTLHIEGSGAMQDFTVNTSDDTRPWKKYLNEITQVVIQEGVASIGDYAFTDMKSLVSVNIPASINDLGIYIFNRDTALTTVEWANGFQAPTIQDVGSKWNTYTGTYVPTGMFDGCAALGENMELSAWLPDSFTGVGCASFRGTAFNVNFGEWNKLTYIGTYAFARMPNLTEVTIKNSYTFGMRTSTPPAHAVPQCVFLRWSASVASHPGHSISGQ